jgi:cyclopropane-fatty-acyl-phospholipid synthase
MTDPAIPGLRTPGAQEAPGVTRSRFIDRILNRFGRSSIPFEIVFPDGGRRGFGDGAPSFTVTLRDRQAVRALASMDEGRVADAYVEGHLDIEGDMLRPFEIRKSMTDQHYAVAAWRFLEPLLFGQVRANRRAIADHYDIDSGFFLNFLDPQHPAYTQGQAPPVTL